MAADRLQPFTPGLKPVKEHLVHIDVAKEAVRVPTGTLLSEAARLAGVEIGQPCGGQGRCGRCTVRVVEGSVRRRSTLRLMPEDIEAGYALACQSVVEGDLTVIVPPQEKIERRLTSGRSAVEVEVPAGYDYRRDQTLQRISLSLTPPSLDDQTDDLSRLRTALRQQAGFQQIDLSLETLQALGDRLRARDWQVTVLVEAQADEGSGPKRGRLIDISPGLTPEDAPLWGIAVDIGTTTVTLWLVDLVTGRVAGQAAEYNSQIGRGEDVISRIIYASKSPENLAEMRQRVLDTIHELLKQACQQTPEAEPSRIMKATVAANSTMMHLMLGIPAANIRLSPFVTAFNQSPPLRAKDAGIAIHPEAPVDCLPGVASYVGADITAGVLASGMDHSDRLALFMDVGTNGEIVLGSNEWLVTCACSAGPAFEGAGVVDGMRATRGAIEEVWINGETFEPSLRVIGGGKPRGLCGSGLISLLAEAFMTGLVDKAGHLNSQLGTPRVRQGEHGWEYVVAWASETEHGRDIVLTHVDIDNLLRAKAAIYAGYTVLAESVGIPLEAIEQMLIGGSFGKYINVEKAVQIGLLPDMPWECFQFLGNTSVRGAYYALLDREARARIDEIAARMTYIELSADNSFYEAFMSAMFLPHTDAQRFPSVAPVRPQSCMANG